jgi:hypothetical protein
VRIYLRYRLSVTFETEISPVNVRPAPKEFQWLTQFFMRWIGMCLVAGQAPDLAFKERKLCLRIFYKLVVRHNADGVVIDIVMMAIEACGGRFKIACEGPCVC